MNETQSKPPSGLKRMLMKLSSEAVLGTLIALLSVLTALAAWQGSKADSEESGLNVEGQKQLTEANSMYLESNQFVIYDYSMFDGWYLNSGKDEEIAEYYYDSFSESLQVSMDRPDGPFDDEYYEEMYAEADSLYDEAMVYFDEAELAGERANHMQLVLLIFAVGLALSAYGALLAPEKGLRIVFTLGAIAALTMGILSYFSA